MTEMMHV